MIEAAVVKVSSTLRATRSLQHAGFVSPDPCGDYAIINPQAALPLLAARRKLS